jgi:hypothetical protein
MSESRATWLASYTLRRPTRRGGCSSRRDWCARMFRTVMPDRSANASTVNSSSAGAPIGVAPSG